MKFITVQPDTDLSNPFTAGHVKVAETMESFAKTEELKISGHLTPYGITCSVTGNTSFFKNFDMKVRRQLENATTDVIPTRSPYSNIIDLTSDILLDVGSVKFRIERTGVIRKLRNKLMRYTPITSNGSHILYSKDTKLGAKISPVDLSSLGKIDWLEFRNQRITLRSLFIPNSDSELVNWLNAIEGLVKRIST